MKEVLNLEGTNWLIWSEGHGFMPLYFRRDPENRLSKDENKGKFWTWWGPSLMQVGSQLLKLCSIYPWLQGCKLWPTNMRAAGWTISKARTETNPNCLWFMKSSCKIFIEAYEWLGTTRKFKLCHTSQCIWICCKVWTWVLRMVWC